MTTPPKSIPQDLPPPGGYGPIQWERVPLRNVFTSRRTLALFTAVTTFGFYCYFQTWKEIKRDEIEMRSARFVILPLLIAERDRMFLKQLRKNRDDERELMKNVPEWEVGTYFGEPIYITKPEGVLVEPHMYEFYAHASMNDCMYRTLRRHLL